METFMELGVRGTRGGCAQWEFKTFLEGYMDLPWRLMR
jgi:hypothetical protein